jgi:hypothetical protein
LGDRMTDPNADVIKGYRFSATLQLRTPLRVLQHHGEFREWSDQSLPTYTESGWQGMWQAVTKSWAELAGPNAKLRPASSSDDQRFEQLFREKLVKQGFTPEEAATVLPNAIASDIGPVPGDGGTYLAFLKAFRGIVEFAASPDEKREAINELSKDNPEFAKYISMHRSQASDWPDEWLGYQEWLQITGIGTRIARCIYDAGFRLPEAIQRATDQELASVKGIGKATIAEIRRVMSQPPSK